MDQELNELANLFFEGLCNDIEEGSEPPWSRVIDEGHTQSRFGYERFNEVLVIIDHSTGRKYELALVRLQERA